MTVSELIKLLETMPQELEVRIVGEGADPVEVSVWTASDRMGRANGQQDLVMVTG